MSDPPDRPADDVDELVVQAARDVDRTLICWALSLSPLDRLRAATKSAASLGPSGRPDAIDRPGVCDHECGAAKREDAEEEDRLDEQQHVEVTSHIQEPPRRDVVGECVVPLELHARHANQREADEAWVVEDHVQDAAVEIDIEIHSHERDE